MMMKTELFYKIILILKNAEQMSKTLPKCTDCKENGDLINGYLYAYNKFFKKENTM